MPRGPFRLPTGGRIDRSARLDVRWNGAQLPAFAGDTLASALLAHGVHTAGRSFRFHRPRGVFSAGIEEPNALVTLGSGARREPSARATTVRARDGLVASAQNCWPSVRFDLARVFDFAAPLLPAGFYHKTFKWPSWHVYEGAIRRAAGLGHAPTEADPDRYETTNAHVDLLIVGAGPAGLHAALAAAGTGAHVLLVDEQQNVGGCLRGERIRIDGRHGVDWAESVAATLRARPHIRVLTATTAFGLYDHGVAALVEQCDLPAGPRARYWRVRAGALVLATGAIEQPLVFEYNDLPGVMLAAAVRRYANEFAVAAGRRVCVLTNNDSAYATAFDLRAAGVEVAAVIDTRDAIPEVLGERLRSEGVRLLGGARAIRARGRSRLTALEVWDATGGVQELACDAAAVSGGWQPSVHLYSQSRGVLRFDAERETFYPAGRPDIGVAGGLAGASHVREAMAQGARAAHAACRALGFESPEATALPSVEELELSSTTGSALVYAGRRTSRCWVDLQHDVTVSDLELAVREGYREIELLKRYTTTGMSVDQGKTSHRNAILIAADLTSRSPAALGTTTFRPPYSPVTLGALAGRQLGERYMPQRRLPAHAEHMRAGAHFEELGGWLRPACYPRANESPADAIAREVLATRHAVTLFDGSPLGKIEVRGPDAGWFLDRFYINEVAGLAVGRVRYGIMLNEQGIVIDDGTIARVAAEHFIVTTTSGGANRIAAWLEEWRQCEWPHREVIVTPVTTQWATLVLSGPRAREVLQRIPGDIALGAADFPHLHIRCGTLAGVPARVYRVSFSGELAFEINVPAACGAPLWRLLLEAGQELGIAPYGIESLLVMRLEKGFLHVGVDTDGSTIPADIGWGAVASRKRGFIGRRSLALPDMTRGDRLQLVGLRTEGRALRAGAHLRVEGTRIGTDGWVTSAASSPTLGHPIALAMLRGGHQRLGERVRVHDDARIDVAEVVTTPFYDPLHERVRM